MKKILKKILYTIIFFLFIFQLSVTAQSDSVSFSGIDEGKYIPYAENEDFLMLWGRIKMEFDGKIIIADEVLYNRKTGDVTLSGNLEFNDGIHKIYAEKCVYNIKEDAGVLYDSGSNTEPVIFNTEKLRIVDKDTYVTKKTKISTCDLERPHYYFWIWKLTIYKDNRSIAYHAIYKVGGVPLFWFPVLPQSEDGIGFVTQFGLGNERRGNFMQNTYKYTSENGTKWKYKLDIYEKLGYYGGIELNNRTSNSSTNIYLAGAKYRDTYKDAVWNNVQGVWDTQSISEEYDNWFKVKLNNNYNFFKRGRSNSYNKIDFEWMNDWFFEKYFDARGEPETTLGMIWFSPQDIAEKRYQYWTYTLGDKGSNHNISFKVQREWYWDSYKIPDDVNNYNLKGRYVPYSDQLPSFIFNYNNFFNIKNIKFNKKAQKINWKFNLTGNSARSYAGSETGEYYSTTNTLFWFLDFNTDFNFFKYLIYTPGFKNGFNAQWVNGPFDDILSYKDDAEIASDKRTFLYYEASNKIKIGPSKFYLQLSHFYRRSYWAEEVVKPFIHEKHNYFEGGFYLYPDPDVSMTVTSRYDARRKYKFDDKLKNIAVYKRFFIDFNRLFSGKKAYINRNSGLFYSGIELINNYLFVTESKESGTNTLNLNYTTGNFSFPVINQISNISAGYEFFRDFRYPFRDTMSITWRISADLVKNWRMNIGGLSQADRAYLLYKDNGFIKDLKKSFYFYDPDKSDNPVFSLRKLFLNIVHDLHCWELIFSYNLMRSTEYFGPNDKDVRVFYEQLFSVSLTLKTFPGAGIPRMQVYPFMDRQDAGF